LEKAIAKCMAPPVSSEAMEKLVESIRRKEAPYTMAICVALVVSGLHQLDAETQTAVVEALNTVTNGSFLGALFQSNWMPKIVSLAMQARCSPSALFMGALEGDSRAGQQLLLILSQIPLPRALYLDLCSRITEIEERKNQRIEALSVALLMDAVLLTDMPEASKCLLLHRLHVAERRDVYESLCSMHVNSGRDIVSDAHRLIASCIDIGACHTVANTTGDGYAASEIQYAWRLPYSKRANVVKPSKSNGQLAIGGQGRDTEKAQLRGLLCNAGDVHAIWSFVHNVLASDRSPKDKIIVLEARADPVPASHDRYKSFSHMYYEKLKGEYCARWQVSHDDFSEYSSYEKDAKRIGEALSTFSRGLPAPTVQKHKDDFNAGRAAFHQNSLPALQVAILTGKAPAVGAYMEAVLDYCGSMPLEELADLLEFRSEGKPAFYTAVTEGSPEVIAAYVQAVLASRLSEDAKIDILDAGTNPGWFGAFYLAMRSADKPADKERVHAFMGAVLDSGAICSNSKARLLRCQKDYQKGQAGLSKDALQRWKRSPETALGAATEKAKGKNAAIAAEIVELYRKLVGSSNMDAIDKKWVMSLS
jgi:hypothetical protein